MPQVLSANAAFTRARSIESRWTAPLRPFLFGSRAGLHRYAVAAEKSTTALGAYDRLATTTYDYPAKVDGSIVDLAYVKLFADNVKLKYFDRAAGSGVGGLVACPNTHANQVRASSLTFAASTGADGTAYPRSANFHDRDVAVGDLVYVRGVVSSTPYSLWSTVAGFVHEQTTAAVAAATAADSNKSTQAASTSYTKVHGAALDNEIEITSVSGVSYDGSATGDLTETYTITVVTGSSGGNATTARLRVVSASGNDDQAEVTPAAFASPTAIGTRGLTVTWDIQVQVGISEIDPNDFVAGQQWTVTVAQLFTKPAATSGGTPAAGMPTTTYIVRVSRGGAYAGTVKPQIMVTTTTGVDLSGPTTVTAAGTPVTIGNYAVTIQFNQTKLSKDDIYYVPVTGVQDGAIKTLVLNNSLPSQLLSASDLDLQLYIPKNNYSIQRNRATAVGVFNWEAADDGFTVESGITVYDASWTDAGVPLALPVTAADLYLEYREWLTDLAGDVLEIDDITTVAASLGIVHPDNPIAYGVYKALQNTPRAVLGGGASDYDKVLCAVLGGDPHAADLAPWQDVLDLVYNRENVYNLVALTSNDAVHSLVASHVAQQSGVDAGRFRAAFVPLQVDATVGVRRLDNTNAAITATLTADPDHAAQITRLFNAAGTANWKTAGVRTGDVVRYNYSTDGYGAETWTEYVVASVPSEDTIFIRDAGVEVPVAIAQRVEVWRNRTKDELVMALRARAAVYNSTRVVGVWPDEFTADGLTVPAYQLCAALAGLAGGVPPHQGLTNVELLGVDGVRRSSRFFSGLQLEQLAAGGVLLVSQLSDGTVYVHKAVTTNPTDVNTTEEMVRRDLDGVRYAILDRWAAAYGHDNITVEETTRFLNAGFAAVVGDLMGKTSVAGLGAMATSGQLSVARPHAALPDKFVTEATITGPFPLNQVLLTLVSR